MKIQLPNGCTCSEIRVHPLTWERVNASIKKPWYIHYRFYDPVFKEKYPTGYQVQIRGMNEFKTLSERQEATKALIAKELFDLQTQFYNPIWRKFLPPEPDPSPEPVGDYLIAPNAPLKDALMEGFKRLDTVKAAKDDIKSTLKYVLIAASQIRIDQQLLLENMPVENVKRRHILMILDQCAKTKKIFTNATFNRYLRNMQSVFKELRKVEAIEYNPTHDIGFKKKTKRIKKLLTDDERIRIDQFLRKEHFAFWRFRTYLLQLRRPNNGNCPGKKGGRGSQTASRKVHDKKGRKHPRS